MPQFHRLDADADARFLQARVADPLTRTTFRATNEVVMCQTCGQVSLRETWEALGGCPNGHPTAAPWNAAAALAAGDGAATGVPRPARTAPAPEPAPRWRTPLLVALGVAGLAVLGVVAAGLLRGDDDAPEETVVAAPAEPTGPRAVSLVEPGLTEGALGADDFEDDGGRYRDLYTFAADSSGKVLSFTVSSADFFPDLVVETPEGDRVEAETLEATDDEGTRTVRVVDLRGPGLYRALVTSRLPAATGGYSLRLRAENPVRPLTAGGSAVQAELGAFSERAEGFFRDRFQFAGVEGRQHTVTVRSSAFAPTVTVTGPGGAVRGETGRAGGVVTFVFTPSADGAHTAVVSSQSPAQRGAYSVQLAVEAEREEPAVVSEPTGTVLRPGGGVRDSLAAGASAAYVFRGRIGDRVVVEARADGFSPSLVLTGPDGTRAAASPDGDRARVRLTLPSAGTYRVVVGAASGEGGYRLTLEQQAAVTSEDIPRLPGANTPREAPGRDEGERPPDYRPQPIDDGRPR